MSDPNPNNRDKEGPSGTQAQASSQPSVQDPERQAPEPMEGVSDNQQTLTGPKLQLRAKVKKLTT